MSECTTAVIGCDLGDKQSTLCILRADGRVERPKPIKTVRSVSDLLLCSPTGPCGDRSGRAFAVGERASGRARPSSDGGKCSTSEADFSERLEIRPGGRGIAGTSWQGRRGAARADSPSRHGSTGGFGGAKSTRRIGGVPDETNQHLSGIGEELRRTTSPVQRREFPPSSKGVRSCCVKAGAGASISGVRANPRGDSEGRQTGGKTGQKVSGQSRSSPNRTEWEFSPRWFSSSRWKTRIGSSRVDRLADLSGCGRGRISPERTTRSCGLRKRAIHS